MLCPKTTSHHSVFQWSKEFPEEHHAFSNSSQVCTFQLEELDAHLTQIGGPPPKAYGGLSRLSTLFYDAIS